VANKIKSVMSLKAVRILVVNFRQFQVIIATYYKFCSLLL